MVTRVVVIGQGYVGLPLAVEATKAGLHVVGLELNRQVVAQLNAGVSHIDDVSNQEISTAQQGGYVATDDPTAIAEADVVVVCVPTPLSDDGGPDLTAVQAAARSIGTHASPNTTVILESTTYPGTTEEIFVPLVLGDRLVLGRDVWIAFSPERVDPGNTQYGIVNTPKVVGGVTPESGRRAASFYSQFVTTVVPAKSAREAEMAKLLENTFRHVNIALVNEMARFSNELEIDLWDAIECASTKPFGYMPFRPGPGVGGHCIPVDPSYLSHRVKARLGYAFRMVELAEEINLAAPGYVADRVWRLLNTESLPVNGAKVLLVGVTYKADISDLRETPALPLAKRLRSWGASISYFDPYAPEWNIDSDIKLESEVSLLDAANSADCVILLQAHSSIDLTSLAETSKLLLDTRAAVPAATPGVHRL